MCKPEHVNKSWSEEECAKLIALREQAGSQSWQTLRDEAFPNRTANAVEGKYGRLRREKSRAADRTTEPKHIATKPHLLTLAQELRYKIFSFAYPNIKILDRKQWYDREWQKLRSSTWDTDYSVRTFRHNIVSDLMVSKQDFVSAGYTYAANLAFEREEDLPADVRQGGGIIYHWCRDAAVRSRRMVNGDDAPPQTDLLYPGSAVHLAKSELR
ncbi:hypothetical protein LTR27_011633 [Elasticomyces elasticus]|nr:hypothetical protein LTR27_011633 [Elasticomyces elasticus]